VAYSTGSQLVVRPVDGAARSAPRVLGVLAPSGLNLITGADTWTLALDASKALSPGTLTIENGTGAIVRTEAVPGAPDGSLRGISWDGKYVSGEPVVPGSYRWTLTQGADDGSGNLVGVDGTAAVGGTINVIREPLGTLVGSVPTLSHKTPVVGQTLSVAEGTWSPSSGLAFTYNWFRSGNGAPIGTGKTYQVTPADLGKHLRAAVTGKVEYWAPTTTVSAYSSTVGKGTLAAPKPTIDNPAPKVGQVLTAQPGTWAPAGATLSYRWYKVSSSGRSTYLKGKVAQTLTVTGSLVRYRLKVKVTGRLAAYDTRSVYSSRTSKVARA
jgi:hypothetical protein